jgi:hypothetical protein
MAALSLALMLASPWAAAAVYKCTDAAGKTTYQAQPCPGSDGAGPLSVGEQPSSRPQPAAKPQLAVPPRTEGHPAWSIATDGGQVAAPAGGRPSAARRAAPPTERLEVPLVRMNFDLLGLDGRRLPWTNAGPKGGMPQAGGVRDNGMLGEPGAPAVLGATGREAYALGGNGGELVWMPQGFGGPKQTLTPPATLPRLSWGSAIAWDTRNGVLAIASQGGEGFFYRYDTRRRTWLGVVSLRNRDLLSLAFDEVTGKFVGLSDALELVVYDAQGNEHAVKPLAGVLPAAAYNQGNPLQGSLTVVARDGVIAIVRISQATVTHIWTYGLAGGIAQLTYKG